MNGPPVLYIQAAGAAALAVALWIWLAKGLTARGLSRWRAAPIGLTLVFAAAGYGLFWLAFFSSPMMAVQTHAVRLAIAHVLDGRELWIAAGWLAICALPLLRMARSRRRSVAPGHDSAVHVVDRSGRPSR